MNNEITLPAEWAEQDAILLAWPHKHTDWAPMLEDVWKCYRDMAAAICDHEHLLIITPQPEVVEQQVASLNGRQNIRLLQVDTNDTWARDFGVITVVKNGRPVAVDFKFNGWGLKFAADKDNLINRTLHKQGLFRAEMINALSFVLEGGSIESDGNGTVMTTSNCLLSPNRNGGLTRTQIAEALITYFGAKQLLWLDYGYLCGDDTDSHIDTLARFLPNNTIVYTSCENQCDVHYQSLHQMASQLASFRNAEGLPYNLVALPLPDPIFDSDNNRLPATYANFLITNSKVLIPTYGQPDNDAKALGILRRLMPDYTVEGVDCTALIQQHGSLHCATMQFPENTITLL